MLEARSLTKYYNHTPAVRGVSFTIRPGEILGYLGPNGAGKSTTVKMLTGLIEPSEGQIFYQGRSVHEDSPPFNGASVTFPKSLTSTRTSPDGSICNWSGRLARDCPPALEPKMDEVPPGFRRSGTIATLALSATPRACARRSSSPPPYCTIRDF